MQGDVIQRRLGRVPGLDGLRGIAIALVVLLHSAAVLTGFAWFPSGPLRELADGGFLGVDLFFVLSGFLITALLLGEWADNRRISLPAFYRRRALRLFPALAVFLVIFLCYALLTNIPSGPVFTSTWTVALYVHNYWTVWYPKSNTYSLGHLWSLSVEEQFYFVWPLVLVLMLRYIRRPALITLALATSIIAIDVHRTRAWAANHHLTALLNILARTDTRADGLLVGALAAWLWARRTSVPDYAPYAAWPAVITLVFIIFREDVFARWLYAYGLLAFSVAGAIIIVATVEQRFPLYRVLEFGPLRTLGRVSYGLYLWHLPVFAAVKRYGGNWTPAARIAVAYVLVTVITAASFKLVEQPMLRFRGRRERVTTG